MLLLAVPDWVNPFTIFIAVGVAGTVFIVVRTLIRGPGAIAWGKKIYPNVHVFAQEFGADISLPGRRQPQFAQTPEWLSLGMGLYQSEFQGELEGGRRARLDFFRRGKNAPPSARFDLAMKNGPAVKIRKELLGDRIVKAIKGGPTSGDKAFDRSFHVESTGPGKKAATITEAHELVRAAFEKFGVEELSLGKASLEAIVPLGAYGRAAIQEPGKTPGEKTRELLELLGRIAASFERVPLRVNVLGGERQALAGMKGSPRCAYCHEDVTGAEPDLVACEKCQTVLHQGCWKDHGHCPVLGCTGTRTR